jgi:hypothetical protein
MFSTPFISTALTLLVGSAAFGAPATTPCANYLCPATDDAGLLLAGSWFTPSPYGHQYHRCDYSTTGTPDTFQNNTTNTCWYDFQPQVSLIVTTSGTS